MLSHLGGLMPVEQVLLLLTTVSSGTYRAFQTLNELIQVATLAEKGTCSQLASTSSWDRAWLCSASRVGHMETVGN